MSSGDDPDGDGRTNLEEFISKCDPNNPESVFHVAEMEKPPAGEPWKWVLTWDTALDRRYSVFTHTNLTTAWPTNPVYQVDGDGAAKSYTNTLQNNQSRFFRIGVELVE